MNLQSKNLHYSFRLYLNAEGRRVLGKGGAQILEAVDEYGSILAAARKLNMSYKFVWGYLTRMHRILKAPLTVTHRGGASPGRRKGGGGTVLTPLAKTLLRDFRRTENRLNSALSDRERSVASSKARLVKSTRRGR